MNKTASWINFLRFHLVFQDAALEKVRDLSLWTSALKLDINIMVDGGINERTSKAAVEAGANTLVAGTFLFKHDCLLQGANKLLQGSI